MKDSELIIELEAEGGYLTHFGFGQSEACSSWMELTDWRLGMIDALLEAT